MFLIVGATLGVVGIVSFTLVAIAMFCGAFKEYEGIEYWISVAGALIRNGLMAASCYAAFNQPVAAPILAWGAFGTYVVLTVGLVLVRTGSFRVGNLISTFYVSAFLIGLCATLLTVLQPPNA